MNDIQVLKEIGLPEVSKRTHIEIKTLQYMLDKEFDKLGRINTLGFLKIISREYHLDLSGWQEEFEAYWDERNGQNPSKAEAVFAVNAPSGLKRSRLKSKLFLLVLVGASIYAVQYFGIWQTVQPMITDKISQWTQTQEDGLNKPQEESVSYTTPSVVNEAQKILEEQQAFEVREPVSVPEMNSTQEESGAQLFSVDGDANEEQIIDENVSEDLMSLQGNVSVSELNDSLIVPTQAQENLQNGPTQGDNSGIILPNVNIWVGIVYLDTKKRASYLTNNHIELDLTREQIITTGHGNFTLELNGEKVPFKEELPKRFHWDGNEMKTITYDKFVELNGGSAW